MAVTSAFAEAQQPAPAARPLAPAPQQPQPPPGPPQSSPGFLAEQRDARETRERLNDIFRQYPPSVREVLRIDPTLMYRADYIGNYPVLAAFLEQHPEIAHNPGFFVGDYRYAEESNNPRLEAARALGNLVEFAAVALIVMMITAGVVFLVRTVVEHRRWQRAMKAQSDLNTKLIDRFASNDDLLAYLQSPQGKALTEAPALPHRAPRVIDAPLNRIFWSVQAGAVLACGGIGLLLASRGLRTDLGPEGASVFYAFGIVVLTVGAGFLGSSVVSYFLSQRLGLVQPLSDRYSGETPAS